MESWLLHAFTAALCAGALPAARGRLAVKHDGHPHFDHRHCIFLHRLPR